MILHRVIPLPRPRHPRGWLRWCPPRLRIITTTTQHYILLVHGTKFRSVVDPGRCMADTWLSPPPSPFDSASSTSHGRNRDYVSGDEEVDSSNADDGMPDPFPTFTAIMDLVCETFPEARCPAPRNSAPLLPGMQRGKIPATTTRLRRAQRIDFRMSQAFEALARANKSTKPFFAKYPAQGYHRCYRTRSDEGRGRPVKVNLVLRISVPQGEKVPLEPALLSSRDTQNFLFLLMGTFVSLTSDSDGLSHIRTTCLSIQRAMVDQARITAFALANTRAARRKPYL